MNPTTICILLGIGETVLFLALCWFVRRGYREALADLRDSHRRSSMPPPVTVPLPSSDDDVDDLPTALEGRVSKLGLVYSKPLNGDAALCLDKDAHPGFSYVKGRPLALATCNRCIAADLRMVYGGKADFFEGCLGCYCFTCGKGMVSNHRLSQEITSQERSDLFLLLRRWERPRPALALVVSLPMVARNTVEPRESPDSSAETPPTG